MIGRKFTLEIAGPSRTMPSRLDIQRHIDGLEAVEKGDTSSWALQSVFESKMLWKAMLEQMGGNGAQLSEITKY